MKCTIDVGSKKKPELVKCTLVHAVLDRKADDPKILVVSDTNQISRIHPIPADNAEAFEAGFLAALTWLSSDDLRILQSASSDVASTAKLKGA